MKIRYLNPLGDDGGILIAFGLCAVVVLLVALALRGRRNAVLSSAAAGFVCGLGVYTALAAVYLLVRGTQGFQFLSWLVFVVGGMIPAAVIGLLEGLVAGVAIRVIGLFTSNSEA